MCGCSSLASTRASFIAKCCCFSVQRKVCAASEPRLAGAETSLISSSPALHIGEKYFNPKQTHLIRFDSARWERRASSPLFSFAMPQFNGLPCFGMHQLIMINSKNAQNLLNTKSIDQPKKYPGVLQLQKAKKTDAPLQIKQGRNPSISIWKKRSLPFKKKPVNLKTLENFGDFT